MLTDRFDRALVYASDLHRKQRRNGTEIPYVSHLLGVASIALEMGADEDQAIAALFHDAVEDQGGAPRLEDIRELYGERVAGIVADCTDWDTSDPNGGRPPWRVRKEAYVAKLADKSRDSLLVSLADKTHNARAIVDDLVLHGDALWSRFAGGRDGSIWYYGALAEAFRAHLPGPASARFAALVEQMGRSSPG
jgi:(p)ppGpp synthase/HD superfamily hydrolase